jgi:glycosyltransferase involved in cell wall biosynthesis
MNTPALSVVVPVYNEEANIQLLVGELVATLDTLDRPCEIIFVDDGSRDGGLRALREAREGDPRIRILSFEENAGQSAAMAAGFRAARGDVIVTLDADLQNRPADIPLLLEQLPEYDMACGWRVNRQDPWIRRLSSHIANAVRNRLSHEQIRDTGCSLKAYKRACLERINLYDGMHRFLPTLFRMEGFRVVEVRVGHYPRRHGVSKYNIRNRLIPSFIDLLAVRWMKKRQIRYHLREEISESTD